jgi:hypothetical protein
MVIARYGLRREAGADPVRLIDRTRYLTCRFSGWVAAVDEPLQPGHHDGRDTTRPAGGLCCPPSMWEAVACQVGEADRAGTSSSSKEFATMARAADEYISKVSGIDRLGPQAVRQENTSLLTQMIVDLEACSRPRWTGGASATGPAPFTGSWGPAGGGAPGSSTLNCSAPVCAALRCFCICPDRVMGLFSGYRWQTASKVTPSGPSQNAA